MKPKTSYVVMDGTLFVPVHVIENRRVFGRNEVLIEPVGGSGQKWIHAEKILGKPVAILPNEVNEATEKEEL